MIETLFHNRRAVQIENDLIRVTVTVEGGHIAEILEKSTGVNPLWIPPWPSIEPSSYSPAGNPEYGGDSESLLLSGIMGHNLCLDLFGPPSDDEAAAGLPVHGEAGVVRHEFTPIAEGLAARCTLPAAQLSFQRRIWLEGRRIRIRETVENLSILDRPIAWTNHVTLGPPFVERGQTRFRVPATKSRAIGESDDFGWPGPKNLEVFTSAEPYGGYTSHLLDPSKERSWFFGWSPASRVVVGYVWERRDFPWMGIWEENRSRLSAPWNGRTITRGMEFGVSPFPESRRQMVERGTLFGTPGYRWVGAKRSLAAEYYAAVAVTAAIPDTLESFEEIIAI
jgi:hypothetical protein